MHNLLMTVGIYLQQGVASLLQQASLVCTPSPQAGLVHVTKQHVLVWITRCLHSFERQLQYLSVADVMCEWDAAKEPGLKPSEGAYCKTRQSTLDITLLSVSGKLDGACCCDRHTSHSFVHNAVMTHPYLFDRCCQCQASLAVLAAAMHTHHTAPP